MNCCYQCEKRTATCHADCPEYAAFAKEAEAIRKNRRREAMLNEFSKRRAEAEIAKRKKKKNKRRVG